MRAATYRKFLVVEESMMRASMPRTNAADPVQLTKPADVVVIANRGNVKLVKPLTFKLGTVLTVAK